MVKNISHAEDFADQLERDCDTDFLEEIFRDCIKITANTLARKSKIINFLKEQKFQFYVVSDSIALLKGVTRGLSKTCKFQNIQRKIINRGFEVINVVQMNSLIDAKVLLMYLRDLNGRKERKKKRKF